MNNKYSDIKLEVVDLNTNATPDLYINQSGLTFSRRILEELNYPQNVQYCTDPTHNIFAIRACKSNDPRSTSFSKSRTEQTKSMHTNNKTLCEIITSLIPNYDSKLRYKIIGDMDTKNRIMYFDLNNANGSLFRSEVS